MLLATLLLLLPACGGGSSNDDAAPGDDGTSDESPPTTDDDTPADDTPPEDTPPEDTPPDDSEPPVTTSGSATTTWISSAPFPGTRSADASFSFDGPDGAVFECNLDDSGWSNCSSPHTVSGVSVGEHLFQVRGGINGSIDSRPASWRWEYVDDVTTLASNGSPFYNNGTSVPAISSLGRLTNQCEALTTLELTNDQSVNRSSELAWSGIPIPREVSLNDTSNLLLVGPDETLVAAQFRPLARWNGALSDSDAPLKWLEVAAVVAAEPSSTSNYSLRYCTTMPSVTDTNALQVSINPDGTVDVDTGLSQVSFDPASASGISSGQVGTATFTGRIQVDGDSVQSATPEADSSEFLVEESGPVKAVIRVRGHVNGLTGPGCSNPPGYTLRWTLTRGSADLDLETDFVNECGDGMFAASPGGAINGSDWWSRTLDIGNLILTFDFSGMDGTTVVTRSSRDGSDISNSGGAGTSSASAVVRQYKGAVGNPSGSDWRWARETITTLPSDASNSVDAEFFPLPVAGVSDANLTLQVQQPWMRFREPQGLAAQSNYGSGQVSVSLYPVMADLTDPFVLGEAQGIWGRGRLSIDTESLSDSEFALRAAHNNAAMERGLLWHSPLWYLNQAKVFPQLPAVSASEMDVLVPLIEGAHENSVTDSILGGAQRDRMKGYSLVGWVDSMQEGIKDIVNTSVNDYSPGSNIWSPTNSELLMWFITGDPKWVWDYALPAEWNLWKSNAYNTGSRGVVGIRSGLVIGSSSIGDGARYRSGYGSDDKFYNQGSGKAYVIRPHRSMAERFQAAGDSVISRYVDTAENREDTVSSRVINRQVMQHLNALRFAADFASENDTALRAKYSAMMQEYIADNLSNGLFCYSDDADTNRTDCAFAPGGVFHYVALWQELFYNHALDLPPGNSQRETIINALASSARLIDAGIPRDGSDEITDFSPAAWGNSYVCDFSRGSDIVEQCVQYNCTGMINPSNGACSTDPTYDNAHLNTLGTVMLGNALDAVQVSDSRCAQARRGFNSNLNSPTIANHLRDSGYGWHKDASQMVQMVFYAIAAAQNCSL
ncbi:MAG: hypothetical protein AB2687_06985 [Candidatus Thiodiazotropha taylori]